MNGDVVVAVMAAQVEVGDTIVNFGRVEAVQVEGVFRRFLIQNYTLWSTTNGKPYVQRVEHVVHDVEDVFITERPDSREDA